MPTNVKTIRIVIISAPLVLAAFASACGSGGTSAPTTLVIQKAATASGDAQTDTVSATLPNPLRAVVTVGTSPHPGDTVTWAASGAGASVTPLNSVTDASGVATTTWKLGHTAGVQTATATLNNATGSPLTFTATATPGVATQMINPTGDGQQGVVGAVLPNPLAVTAADQFGNGVPGIAIAWQVTSGSASVNPTNATSNATGIAQTTVTLGGTPGPITITAMNASLAGSPRSFDAAAQVLATTAAVTVGPNISFTSDRNNSSNPAVDTVAVGGTVTWTWAANSVSHSVRSAGSPSFTSSAIKTTGSYSFTFTSAGAFHYDCAVHGSSMSGTIVVR